MKSFNSRQPKNKAACLDVCIVVLFLDLMQEALHVVEELMEMLPSSSHPRI